MKQAPRLWAFAAALMASWPASADMPVLTITGAVEDSSASWTLSDLRDLPQHQLTTSTTVTDGAPVFEGFLMRDLLSEVHAQGDMIIARALNDYRMEIPISDFENFDVLGLCPWMEHP